MVENSQNSNLQQSGGGSVTGNPQQTGQPTAQNQISSTLQPSGILSSSAFNQLNQGSTKISVVGSSKASQSTATVVATPPQPKPILMYGGVGIIMLVILAGMVYVLRRPR